MSVNGISAFQPPLIDPKEKAGGRVEQGRTPPPPPPPTPPPAAAEASKPAGNGLLAPRQEGLPATPPAGTDPELWQVLTAEERAYFAKITSMGPLTYGRPTQAAPTGNNEAPAVRGGRIDVRA
jgi:hypothetical protein